MSKLILVLRESYFWGKTMTWLVEDGLEEATGAISVGAIRYDHDKSLWENLGGNTQTRPRKHSLLGAFFYDHN